MNLEFLDALPLKLGLFSSLFLLMGFVSPSTFAAMTPLEPFCEHQGYTVETIDGNKYCVFNNSEKCDLQSFYNRECGSEHIREFPCVKEGSFVFPQFEKCCPGSSPFLKRGFWGAIYVGQPTCKSNSILALPERMGYGIFLTILVIVLGIIGLILWYAKKRSKRGKS